MDYRKIIIAAIILTLILAIAAFGASEAVYNWYNINNNNHMQPRADAQLEFIYQHNALHADLSHGDDYDDKVIYLTFDAGYENGNVAKILDTLKAENVPAAFFVLENLITHNTDLIKRMQNEGHLVCNHTRRHKNMANFSKDDFIAELSGLDSVCIEKTGQPLAKYYRPPEGCFNASNLDWASEMGYKTVFWSFAYADWDNAKQPDKDTAIKKILDHTHNGEIILLHPTSSTNAAILGTLIKEWRAMGYRFGSLDEIK